MYSTYCTNITRTKTLILKVRLTSHYGSAPLSLLTFNDMSLYSLHVYFLQSPLERITKMVRVLK